MGISPNPAYGQRMGNWLHMEPGLSRRKKEALDLVELTAEVVERYPAFLSKSETIGCPLL